MPANLQSFASDARPIFDGLEGAFTNEDVVLRVDYHDFGIPVKPDGKTFVVFRFAVRGQVPIPTEAGRKSIRIPGSGTEG